MIPPIALIEHLPGAAWHVRSPGRVNLLGEHVDYNDGLVLPAAVDRYVEFLAKPGIAGQIHLHALDMQQQVTLSLENLTRKVDIDGKPLPAWALYPAGVAWALQEAGYAVYGADVVYASNLPVGAGLSSSAAVEVGMAVLWQALGGLTLEPMTLARLCQKAENEYVGVNCGLMDQFACANGVAGHAVLLDTRSLDWQAVPLPPGVAIIIADSGVRRSLTNSAYNNRRADCETALRILQRHLPDIRALRDVSPIQFAQYAHEMDEGVRIHARHVVEEIARVEEALVRLRMGDADGFGRLMLACHASLRDLFQVSIPELDLLVELAQVLPGCYGARLTGAGFGGCTVNLVRERDADSFITSLAEQYARRTGRTAEVYLCHAADGARAIQVK